MTLAQAMLTVIDELHTHRTCLFRSDVLCQDMYLAALHRRRFEQMLHLNPLGNPRGWMEVFSVDGIPQRISGYLDKEGFPIVVTVCHTSSSLL